jgi:hypothetical protein
MRKAALVLAAAGALVSPAGASNATVKASLLRGVAQIRGTHDMKKLDRKLVRTIASLRRDRASTSAGLRGRTLAIAGFTWTLRGVKARRAFEENDSGNIEAAIRDARRADRYFTRGANRLRAAGRAFGLRIGKIRGF